MMPFTPEERASVARAITRAEATTSGEIIVVAAGASDGYRSFVILWAALLALAVPIPLILLTNLPIEYICLLQCAMFIAGWVRIPSPPLRCALVRQSVKHARCHQRAVEQFLAQNLHTAKGRTGVLIYVAFAAHYAEVIADEGIYRKV